VNGLLAEDGAAPSVRLTAPLLMGRMKKIRESLSGAAVLKKVRALKLVLDDSNRQALAGEIDKVRDVLGALAREVRAR
jgi:hypothetical protein